MDKPMTNSSFNTMAGLFKLRDLFRPRIKILKEVGLKPGFTVLDYGCGPGGYILPTARLIGDSGRIFAIDLHPMAIRRVNNIVKKNNLTNVKTIQSDCDTGLPPESVDVILLYDIFHGLSEPVKVLNELHKVLKPDGWLSFSDHHMEENDIRNSIGKSGLFKMAGKGLRTYKFSKI